VKFLTPHMGKFDAIVPVPPSQRSRLQPVTILAEGIAKALDVPVLSCVTATRSTAQLKDIDDPEDRRRQVEGLYTVDAAQTRGRSILLFDDLFRSGTTMNAIAGLLSDQGQASDIRALTITRTRRNR
jgi:predicted amidophosphoribosyltransferase